MARANANKLYRTFTKGLITEAGFLTYPENASTDELNTVIKIKGTRSRRLGMDYEPSSTASTISGMTDGDILSEYAWRSVGNDANLDFLCVQIGSTIHFYNLKAIPLSGAKKTFTVDLTDNKLTGTADADVAATRCQMVAGKGFLFVAHSLCEPIVVEYDATTNDIEYVPIIVQIRDFDGVDDELMEDEQPATLTAAHFYNLRNQGWVNPGQAIVEGASSADPYVPPALPANTGLTKSYGLFSGALISRVWNPTGTKKDPIQTYYARMGKYPANNQQWWVARSEYDDASRNLKQGDFLPELLDKLFLGNMRSPRGHFILHAFEKNRSLISGINSLATETVLNRPPTIAFFSGRVWYGGQSTVYFSQILTTRAKAGLCYMEADPTSEHLSDPVDTDGGVIVVPEAHNIVRLVPHAGGVMVFAENGVWYITGTQNGFTALDISVNKVSPIGCKSPMSVVETDTAVLWWSAVGIMGVTQNQGQYGPIQGAFDKTNISETTIQSLYNDIPDDIRAVTKGVYDAKANTVMWLYRDEDTTASQYNKVLILDLTLQAFYPWTFSMIEGGPKIKGIYATNRENTYTVDTDIRPSFIEYVVCRGTDLRIGQVNNGALVDWQTFDGDGATYNSYVEAGYELLDDAMRDKNITYLFAYLTRTEDEDGNNPSSCKMRVKWDWSSGEHSNKWTTETEVYRPNRFLPGNADTGFGMVVTKNKVRGNGKAIQFRFGTDEAGKNFDLNGWSIAVTGNITP
jgi:hypothetical protein